MSSVAPPSKTRILFSANRPIAPRNPRFGQGLEPQRRLPIGPSEADRRWWIEQTLDDSAPSAIEEADRGEMLSMTAREFRELELETRRYNSYDRWIDERAEDAALADRMEGLPALPRRRPTPAVPNVHHVLKADDGMILGVILDGQDPIDLDGATTRANATIALLGPLPAAAWLARKGGILAMLDRDQEAKGLAFNGFTMIKPATVESAFGITLPR